MYFPQKWPSIGHLDALLAKTLLRIYVCTVTTILLNLLETMPELVQELAKSAGAYHCTLINIILFLLNNNIVFHPRCLNNSSLYHTATLDMVHQPVVECRQAIWCQVSPLSSSLKDIILTDSLLNNKGYHTCHTQHNNSQPQCKDRQLWGSSHKWDKHQLDSHQCSNHLLCDGNISHELQDVCRPDLWQGCVTWCVTQYTVTKFATQLVYVISDYTV